MLTGSRERHCRNWGSKTSGSTASGRATAMKKETYYSESTVENRMLQR